MKENGYSPETYFALTALFQNGDSIAEILTALAMVIGGESSNCHRGGFLKATEALELLGDQLLFAAKEIAKDEG